MSAEPEKRVVKVDIESIILRLVSWKGEKQSKAGAGLTELEIKALCVQSREVFMSQPMLLELQAPLKIVGDLHGQFHDLLRLFECGGYPPETNYLFLGDYVDRGKYSLETICLLLAYKIKYPENFFPLAGQPRGRLYQPLVRFLRGVQAEVQHEAVENIHGLF